MAADNISGASVHLGVTLTRSMRRILIRCVLSPGDCRLHSYDAVALRIPVLDFDDIVMRVSL